MNLTEMIGQERIAKGMWWSKGCGLQLVEGCTKVSPGCDNCWSLTAANMRRFNPNAKTAARYEGTVWKIPGQCPQWTGQVNPKWQDLDKIGRSRTPKVYTFWNDLFHPGVPFGFVDDVMGRILLRLEHFYIVCTKRPERALEYFSSRSFRPRFKLRTRLMIMTTAETQEMADLRLHILLQIPGVLHGVSVEPGLSRVDLSPWLRPNPGCSFVDSEDGTCAHPDSPDPECHIGSWCAPTNHQYRGLDWVLCGGEAGPHARPMHPDIPRKLRDDCVAAGVPFFFKAWGEWKPALLLTEAEQVNFWNIQGKREWGVIDSEGNWFPETTPWNGRQGKDSPEGEYTMLRVGKKAAGRLLDGRTWDQVPEVAP